jgi:hypothetical protein
MTRLRMRAALFAFTFLGLLMLGGSFWKALLVAIGFQAMTLAGFGWPAISAAVVAIFTLGAVSWTAGVSLLP